MSDKTETTKRPRAARKKVYERVRESALPEGLREHFKKDDWELRLVRWILQGDEDYRYLAFREKEGYEVVTIDEIPEQFHQGLNVVNGKNRQGLVTIGDLVLMKIDTDLRASRRKVYQDITDQEVNSVDIHVLEKKHGFRNLGTKSKVYMKEPTFQD
jgi:hypothetical protein